MAVGGHPLRSFAPFDLAGRAEAIASPTHENLNRIAIDEIGRYRDPVVGTIIERSDAVGRGTRPYGEDRPATGRPTRADRSTSPGSAPAPARRGGAHPGPPFPCASRALYNPSRISCEH